MQTPVHSDHVTYASFSNPCEMTLGNTLLSRGMTIGEVNPFVNMGYQNGMPFRIGVKLGEGYLQVYIAPKYSDDE